MKWIIHIYYQNKKHSTEKFLTREDALVRFNSLSGAFKFGLVGWSVSYPSEEK
jgi:hypothetical protein